MTEGEGLDSRLRGNNGGLAGDSSSNDRWIQIVPVGVLLFDQAEFPLAVPFLELLLAKNRGIHILVQLVVDQRMHPVFLGESFDRVISMLPNAAPSRL